MQLQLNVKYVNKAKPGKKFGTVKTEDGTRYMLNDYVANQIQPGSSVRVEVHEEDWGNGRVTIIDKVLGQMDGTGPARAQNGATGGNWDEAKNKQIWVQGISQAIIGNISGGIQPKDMNQTVNRAVQVALDAWDMYQNDGHSAAPPQAAPQDDVPPPSSPDDYGAGPRVF